MTKILPLTDVVRGLVFPARSGIQLFSKGNQKNRFSVFVLAFLLSLSQLYAQDRIITGKVTSSDDGASLPGVNVVLKGTATGTVTDSNGNYSLSVPSSGGSLIFSFIGLASQEIEIGSKTTIDALMSQDVTQLGEVVVTAIGIERERKALGYAVSEVSGERLEQKSEGDIGRLLRGKAAGVNITQTNGLSGSATNIVIRGFTSITGGNQPLFVVDGVPFDGSANIQQNFADGQTESSRFLDLDPNNVESVNVLKGLSATVLYGDRGRNGVILITTKNGLAKKANKKRDVTFTQSYFVNEIASLPDYNDKFGSGFHQNYGLFFSNWGPSFQEQTTVPHPYGLFTDATLQAAFPEYVGAQYEYKNYKNNVADVFRKGGISTTSVNFRGGNDAVSYNVNYTHYDDKGFTPGNNLMRNNFGFGGNAKLNNKFTIGATFNYTNTDYTSPPVAASLGSGIVGGGSSAFGDIFYTPRNIDLTGLPFESPIDNRSVYYRSGNDIQNPRWTLKYAKNTQLVDRFYGQANVRFHFSDKVNLMYRVGLDTYGENNSQGQSKGARDGAINGFYRTISVRNKIWNHDLILSGDINLGESFKLNALAGFNGRRDEYYQQGVESSNQVVFGVLKHFNFIDHSTTSTTAGDANGYLEFENSQNRIGTYAQALLTYKEFLYLTLSARKDWSNTLERANNSIFYPGASLAFDVTSALESLKNSEKLNFLKLRMAYGSSANFPGPYSTRNTLGLTSRAIVQRDGTVVISNTQSNTLGNPDLKPERLQEVELGLESQMFNNKLNINASVFKKTTHDLIINQNLDPSTGYTLTTTNAGDLEVKGLEVELNGTVFSRGDFSWNIIGVFSKLKNMVTDLPAGINQIQITGFAAGIGNYAIKGQPFGIMQGNPVERDANGNRIIDAQGFYKISNSLKIIGNPTPDFTSGLTNTFSYKGVKLSVEFQYTHGGDIYSRTANALVGRGVTKDTDFDRFKTYVLPGVTDTGEPNTKVITATNLYFENYFGIDDFAIYDGTTIRLNDVSLSYALPASLLSKTPFGSINLTATGYNLWYKAVNLPEHVNFDTNVLGTGVGNGQGIDFLSGPSSRRYGVSLQLTF